MEFSSVVVSLKFIFRASAIVDFLRRQILPPAPDTPVPVPVPVPGRTPPDPVPGVIPEVPESPPVFPDIPPYIDPGIPLPILKWNETKNRKSP